MNETTEMWRDVRHEQQAQRSTNRERGAFQLTSRGFKFESKNDGAHLVVKHGGRTVDYWPGPGKWIVRGSRRRGHGVFDLMRLLEQTT